MSSKSNMFETDHLDPMPKCKPITYGLLFCLHRTVPIAIPKAKSFITAGIVHFIK